MKPDLVAPGTHITGGVAQNSSATTNGTGSAISCFNASGVCGLPGGGINFDAKISRSSTDASDLFYAHIGGMDTFARALITADAILNKSDFKQYRKERYASFDSGKGKEFENGKLTLEDLRTYAIENGEPAIKSGKQEYLENVINNYI